MDAVLDAEIKDTLRLIALHETGQRYVQEMVQKCTNPEHRESYEKALEGLNRILRDLKEELRVKEGLVPVPIGLEIPAKREAYAQEYRASVIVKHEEKPVVKSSQDRILEIKRLIAEETDADKLAELKQELSRLTTWSIRHKT